MLANDKILGIIFPNMHDEAVSELTQLRTMASVPFGGRYRLIDFTLSSFVAAGITNVCVVPRTSYISLMDHLGSGKEWDLARKRGGLKIFPPYSEAGTRSYRGKVEALIAIKKYIESSPCEIVILADCGIVSAVDYKEAIQYHFQQNAGITMVYKKEILDTAAGRDNMTLELKENQVTSIFINGATGKECNASMWSYILSKKMLLKILEACVCRGLTNFERDILQGGVHHTKIIGYEYKGYSSRITSLKSYFESNLALLQPEHLTQLFGAFPIYTKIRDDAPVRYTIGSASKNIIAGDGCFIEGQVENCVLFRGVKIGKGAVVKNCVLMQDTIVQDQAVLKNVICDKSVVITKEKMMIGTDTHPIYIGKKAIV